MATKVGHDVDSTGDNDTFDEFHGDDLKNVPRLVIEPASAQEEEDAFDGQSNGDGSSLNLPTQVKLQHTMM